VKRRMFMPLMNIIILGDYVAQIAISVLQFSSYLFIKKSVEISSVYSKEFKGLS